ncbi:hypothetical protein BJ165DRAFT_15836 [Panaeolus papilionaceus]|nr:hypothetical protein BJ165DRAFT_15836 [Panaeolus papilionaceus]
MADFVRTPKPASDWCTDGLQSYNIHVHDIDHAHTFFNQGLPHSQEPVAMREFTLKLLNFADLLMSLEATTDAFALLLLHDLDFECDYSKPGFRCLPFLRPNIPFRIGGEPISAIPDFVVRDASSATTLLVGEDKRAQVDEESDRVAPQLIAQSIGAFTENNEIRRDRGQEPLLSMVIPRIGMAGGMTRFCHSIPSHRYQ